MTGTLTALAAATAAFTLGHFLLSSHGPRGLLVKRLGEPGFLAVYSLIAIATFVWLVASYAAAPFVPLYAPPPWAAAVPAAVMPFAAYLVVCGYTMRNPTAVYPGPAHGAGEVPRGIVRVTRHPVMWGIALWAAAHLAANGDAASVILFTGLLALALGGAAHIDRRARRRGGERWAALESATSFLPLAAWLGGRTRIGWRDLGGWRIAAALVLYGVLLVGHPWIAGVALLPG